MNTPKVPQEWSIFCGSFLTVAVTINFDDVLKSCLLGAIGTIVSYAITRLLKIIFE